MKQGKVFISRRHIYPQKFSVKQGETGTISIRFELDDYRVGDIDLRDYSAYVVTSMNGYVDMIGLDKEVQDDVLYLTWRVSQYPLRYSGNIAYQIVFKQEGAPDGVNSAVYKTYQAILQVSESIEVDEAIAADYPTILKQWFDRISSLSSVVNEPIIFMQPDQTILPENRMSGNLYYQWLEQPTLRASYATGFVNLGDKPYNDIGLYVNNTHIYLDEALDATNADAWVAAINNANCGVSASNDTTANGIKIKLTALVIGTTGNSIPIEFGMAKYGEGANTANPCNCAVSGATLSGANDDQTGADHPTGRFEDANGNILCYNRAKHVENANLNELLESGDYVCTGTMTNNPVSDNTYCTLRVIDSTESERVTQECLCIDTTTNKLRTFVRTLVTPTDVGDWLENVNKGAIESNKVLVSDENKDLISHPTVGSTELSGLDGYDTSKGTVETRLEEVEGGLVGEIKWFAGKNVPSSYLICAGGNVSRTKYARLFEVIGTTWGEGDGSTTFTLPNLINKVAWGAANAGGYKEAGLPNITGEFGKLHAGFTTQASGAFAKGSSEVGTYGKSNDTTSGVPITFNASKSNSIYGKSSTVQPPAAVLIPIIRW